MLNGVELGLMKAFMPEAQSSFRKTSIVCSLVIAICCKQMMASVDRDAALCSIDDGREKNSLLLQVLVSGVLHLYNQSIDISLMHL